MTMRLETSTERCRDCLAWAGYLECWVNLRKQVFDREETWTLVIMIRNLADGRDQMAFVGAVED